MAITAGDVNKLRQMTGAGMMDCKKALVESDGDFEKAIDFLRKKGLPRFLCGRPLLWISKNLNGVS